MLLDLTLAKIMQSIRKKRDEKDDNSVKSGLEFMLIVRVKMHREKIIIIK